AIREIAPRITLQGVDEKLDARGQVVSPGFVDLHVHLREPGGENSETLESGLSAAVAGGFTAVCPMPNTDPVNDSPESTRAMIDKAQRLGLARVFPIAAVSVRSAGEELTDFAGLVVAGAVAFSDDGRPVKTAALMKQALEKAQGLAVPVVDHCEDTNLSAGGVMNESPVSRRLNLKGIPNSAEEVCIARDLDLAEATGTHLHIAHLSTGRGLEMVRAAKRRGVRVTCEVTPHHFTLSDETVAECGTNAKMNPPLRSLSDVEALRTELVHPGRISLWHLISLLSAGPARVVHKPLGRLRVGGEADITLFNPQLEWTYQAAQGRSKSRNSPFDGWKLKGAVTATIVAGKLVYRRPL
ncbi:MAG: dihydroorotase, partial [Acidobacteria bacterium]